MSYIGYNQIDEEECYEEDGSCKYNYTVSKQAVANMLVKVGILTEVTE